jgi:hypothetical protein
VPDDVLDQHCSAQQAPEHRQPAIVGQTAVEQFEGFPAMANQGATENSRPPSAADGAGSPPSQSSGTGGGGMSRDEERYSKDRKPTQAFDPPPAGSGDGVGPSATAGGSGISSGLEPGGLKPSNERLAGQGAIGTPGGNTSPTKR